MINSQIERMRVYWIRNVPSKAQYWLIVSMDEGLALLLELAAKDLKDPSVESNVGGIEILCNENQKDQPFEWIDLPLNHGDRTELEQTLAELELPVSKNMLDLYFGAE
ncbi:MAG: hypothetical protein ACRC2V_19275 [Xenococcaceae cyanobacterium]